MAAVVATWDHFIAFALLGGIGGKMIYEAVHADDDAPEGAVPAQRAFAWRALLPLAIATSIDAFAAGITLPLLGFPLLASLAVIGLTTFSLSLAGVYAGRMFGYRLGRAWGIGQKGKDNGALLIVAPNERKVRIEVGRGLESQLTDAMTKLIIENAILPAFRRGDFAGGIRAGVRDIKDVVLGDAEAVKQRAQGGRPAPGTDTMSWVLIAFWLVVLAFVIWAMVQQMQQQQTQTVRRQRGRPDGGPVIIPSDWGNSGGWGGGSGGGGWSGGGGDFGGGGSSGSW